MKLAAVVVLLASAAPIALAQAAPAASSTPAPALEQVVDPGRTWYCAESTNGKAAFCRRHFSECNTDLASAMSLNDSLGDCAEQASVFAYRYLDRRDKGWKWFAAPTKKTCDQQRASRARVAHYADLSTCAAIGSLRGSTRPRITPDGARRFFGYDKVAFCFSAKLNATDDFSQCGVTEGECKDARDYYVEKRGKEFLRGECAPTSELFATAISRNLLVTHTAAHCAAVQRTNNGGTCVKIDLRAGVTAAAEAPAAAAGD